MFYQENFPSGLHDHVVIKSELTAINQYLIIIGTVAHAEC